MSEPIRILCVDDEINILNVIRRQLFEQDVEVHAALTAEEGLRLLHQLRAVHVVLSDYRMPGMNGIEFLRKVYQERPAVVGIIISGYADAPAVREAMANNDLFTFIPKPWKAEEIQNAVAEAVAESLARLSKVELP